MAGRLGRDRASEDLLAWANCPCQTAVVNAIGRMPKRLTKFNSFAEDFNFFSATSGSICWDKGIIQIRYEIFIVTVSENRFKHVLASTHVLSFTLHSSSLTFSRSICRSQLGRRYRVANPVRCDFVPGDYSRQRGRVKKFVLTIFNIKDLALSKSWSHVL